MSRGEFLMISSRRLCCAVLALAMLGAPAGASAEEIVWATGRVLDAATGAPVAGATVAVYDSKNRVVDYVKTDEHGAYALAIPRSALNLPKKRGGFLHQVSRTVNQAATSAGGFIAAPIKAGVRAAASAAGASDPISRAGVGAAAGVISSIVDIVTGAGATRRTLPSRSPGSVTIRVAADTHGDVAGLGRVYWMQEELYRVGGAQQRALVAWMDPIRLGRGGEGGPATLTSDLLCFTEARITPAIAQRGQEVRLSVRFKGAEEPRTPVVIVARNSRTGRMYELKPVGGDLYETAFTVEPKQPLNDQVITVIAYAGQDTRPGRIPEVERALERAGYWDPKRAFQYNPLMVAGRNRVELTLTVVPTPGKR